MGVEKPAISVYNRDRQKKEKRYFYMDHVNHPCQYDTGNLECTKVNHETQGIEADNSFCICNDFKYLYRHEKKTGLEEIKKAQWYLNKNIELSEKEGAKHD